MYLNFVEERNIKNTLNMKNLFLIAITSSMMLFSCGDGSSDSENQSSQKSDEKKETPKSVDLVIEGTDDMKFNKKMLKVKSGQEVTLTLRHVGKLKKESMGHNWVLLKNGVDLDEFNMAAYEAGIENDHIPDSEYIIAHTALIGGGEETSVTFTAPDPGKYTFICSFPGHISTMKGSFIVS